MQRILLSSAIGLVLLGGIVWLAQKPSRNESNGQVENEVSSLWPAKSIQAYTQDATAIVIGKFVGKSSESKEANGQLTSQYTFLVEKVIKGTLQAGQEISLIEVTGYADGRRPAEHDRLAYAESTRQLLFLGTDEFGRLGVYAGPNGQYQVDQNSLAVDNDRRSVKLSDLEQEIETALKKK